MSMGLCLDAIPVAVLFAMRPSATGKWDSAYRSILAGATESKEKAKQLQEVGV